MPSPRPALAAVALAGSVLLGACSGSDDGGSASTGTPTPVPTPTCDAALHEAAWTIAQHSDLDPAFQARALELLRGAVADGDASPGNLAYLEDHVVGTGRPQGYGTQVGCAPDGPEPSTPIEERAGLEQRRPDAGLDPYADYPAEMTEVCAEPG